MAEAAETDLSFELALAELDQVVGDLENGQISLEQSLSRYERGVKLLKHCCHLLQNVEQRIMVLTGLDENGKPLTQEFEPSLSQSPPAGSRSARRQPGEKADEFKEESSELFE